MLGIAGSVKMVLTIISIERFVLIVAKVHCLGYTRSVNEVLSLIPLAVSVLMCVGTDVTHFNDYPASFSIFAIGLTPAVLSCSYQLPCCATDAGPVKESHNK